MVMVSVSSSLKHSSPFLHNLHYYVPATLWNTKCTHDIFHIYPKIPNVIFIVLQNKNTCIANCIPYNDRTRAENTPKMPKINAGIIDDMQFYYNYRMATIISFQSIRIKLGVFHPAAFYYPIWYIFSYLMNWSSIKLIRLQARDRKWDGEIAIHITDVALVHHDLLIHCHCHLLIMWHESSLDFLMRVFQTENRYLLRTQTKHKNNSIKGVSH